MGYYKYGLLPKYGHKKPQKHDLCENTTITVGIIVLTEWVWITMHIDMKCVKKKYAAEKNKFKCYAKLYASKIVSRCCWFESLGFYQARQMCP